MFVAFCKKLNLSYQVSLLEVWFKNYLNDIYRHETLVHSSFEYEYILLEYRG